MEISSTTSSINSTQNTATQKIDFSKKISNEEVKQIQEDIASKAQEMILESVGLQSDASLILGENKEDFQKNYEEFQSFLKDIGYESSKSLSELSQEEAKKLVSEDGLFGVQQTAQRISEFVISGADGAENLLRAGREGIVSGFKEAEKIWGEELPKISQDTIKEALKTVDLAMSDLGFSIVDKRV